MAPPADGRILAGGASGSGFLASRCRAGAEVLLLSDGPLIQGNVPEATGGWTGSSSSAASAAAWP